MTNENWQGINFKDSSPIINNPTFKFGLHKQNPPKYIPYIGSANFVGREHELTILHEQLQPPGTVAISAVAGMGGVGKTELAVRYARQHEADYPGGICWLNARDLNLAAEIVQFAQLYMNLEVPQELGGRQLSIEQQVEWCWQNWRPTEGVVLVVLDDVMDVKSCRKLLPKANRFRVLMTTRLRRLDTNFVEISLDVLSKENALKLLIGVLGEQDQRVRQESQTAESLCAWLGYLPLGLELVGRYLVEDPDLFLAELLQRLKNQSLQDEAVDPSQEQLQDTEMTAKRGMKAAFELSWLELNRHTQCVGELLSLFAPDVIPWDLVKFMSQSLNWVEADVNKAKKLLYKLYLIQPFAGKENGYKIHPLIREFLKVKLARSEQADDLKRAFTTTFVGIAKDIPTFLDQEFIKLVKDAIPHLAQVAENLIDAVSDENLIRVFVGLGRFYSGQGLYTSAEPWLEKCLFVLKSRLGESHTDVATSLMNLASLYHSQGRYTKAEPIHQQALSMTRQLLGELHTDVATSLNNLAGLYYCQGRYTEAEPLLQQVLSMRRQLLGELHTDVATSLNNLAGFYYCQKRYTEAEALLQQALSIMKQMLGESHPHVANSYNNLALLYHSQGRYTEAESLYQQALSMRKQMLGESHLDVANSYNNLASLYHSQERYTEVEALLQQALSMRKQMLGELHPDVANSYSNLAVLYDFQGRYTEAKPLYVKALDICEQQLGAGHPSTILVRGNYAAFLKRAYR